MRILIVEDDKTIGNHILSNLSACGYNCDWADNGLKANELCAVEDYDCIILDRMLPDIDGIEICREIRESNITTPILFLTALSGVDQKVQGLDSGGDDYLVKPFDMDELIARIKALVRRGAFKQQVKITVGNIILDTQKMYVNVNGDDISLSNGEFRLLEYLMRNTGIPVTRTQILEHVWGIQSDSDSNMVDVYINYLRNKIDTKESGIHHIETIRGYGYRFIEND